MEQLQNKIQRLCKYKALGIMDINTLLPCIVETDIEHVYQIEGATNESLIDIFVKIIGYRIDLLRICEDNQVAYTICFIETIKTLAQIEVYGFNRIPIFTRDFVARCMSNLERIMEEHDLINGSFIRTIRDYFRFGDTKVCEGEIILLDMSYAMECKIRALAMLQTLIGECEKIEYNSINLHFIYKILFEITMITPNTQFRNYSTDALNSWRSAQDFNNEEVIIECNRLKRERMDELIEVIRQLSWKVNKRAISKAVEIEQKNILRIAIALGHESLFQILYEKNILSKTHIEETINIVLKRDQLNLIPMLIAIYNA